MPGRDAQPGLPPAAVPDQPAALDDPAALDEPDQTDPRVGQRLARLILLTVLCGFLAVQLISILSTPAVPAWKLAVDVVSLCVLFALQALVSFGIRRAWPPLPRLAVLAAQALVTYVPLAVLGTAWGGMAGFLGGSALLLLAARPGWILFCCVVASILAWSVSQGLDAYSVAYLVVATTDTGLVVFGLSRLTAILRYVHATRAQLAQLAVVRERARFARDLHDLLGYSLSAITLKAEVARRLIAVNPAHARDELAEILDISRQALADVRTVASGYRDISLEKEAASVTALLATAGIAVRAEIGCAALDDKIDTVLATVLREAVTNLLRHSAAQTCVITARETAGTVSLLVSNDGAPPGAVTHRRGGGLENLAVRLAAVGGALRVTARDATFEVLATVPLTR